MNKDFHSHLDLPTNKQGGQKNNLFFCWLYMTQSEIVMQLQLIKNFLIDLRGKDSALQKLIKKILIIEQSDYYSGDFVLHTKTDYPV